jgi:xylulokinase
MAWSRDGRAVAETRASYPLLQPAPNWYEQEAEAWWRGACSALSRLTDEIDATRVEALCITHQRESFVPVDRHGKALHNAILWLDGRSHGQVREMERTIGAERFHQLTGKPLTTNPSATKILWLARNEPEIVTEAFMFLDAHAFLVQRLTGAFRTSLASADPMGLVDMGRQAWSADLLQAVGLRHEQLPKLVEPGTVIGTVNKQAAAATGLPSGLPLVAGAGDGQCAGLGANAIGVGRAALNLGTAVVSGTLVSDYVVDRAFRTLYAPIAGTYYLETVIQGGMFTVSWFVDRFHADLRDASGGGRSPEENLEDAAARVAPGALGLMLVPYWNHAMTPYWDPAATGITIGWTGAHGPEHFYRAVLEGLAFEQRLVGDGVMAATGSRFAEYAALGGGSRSDLFCQIIADVTGVPVVRSTTTEATCLGAGILAAAAAGWYPDAVRAAGAMTSLAERFEPEPGTRTFYDRLYTDVYRPLYPTLQPLVNRLTELTRETP